MDTSALKSFAPEVRRQLLEAVERKLDFVLTGDTADLRAAAQVAHLRAQEQAGRSRLIERVAYTWFNRLAALRFLDARGWHPFRVRVLTPSSPGDTQPEILRLVRSGVVPEELKPFIDQVRLNDLLDGRLPSFDPQAEVYRHLVLAACRYYHALLPFLFERLDDETELLLPDDLLTEHSVAQGFRTQISDADCAEVEVLGWLYQFYISEKKDQVMARKTAVPSEDIPAVTQLFTPHWIVRYLVENSLGRLWLRSRPGSGLRAAMPYYVDDPEGQAPADSLTVSRAEEIRLLDPACGSGHMLTYAFDLLFQIYEEEGHAAAEIPEKILTHNLYGLEICPRATQLAQFALLAKARERSRSVFRDAVQPQVMCLEDVVLEAEEVRSWRDASGLTPVITEKVLRQLHQFREDTRTFGSLIQPVLDGAETSTLKDAVSQAPEPTDLLLAETQRKVLLALDQAEALAQRYHVVVTNPPYMGSGSFDPALRAGLEGRFKITRSDLFAVFLERVPYFVRAGGCAALITMQSWMFTVSYRELRENVLGSYSIASMLQLGTGAFDSISGEVVSTTAFVLLASRPNSNTTGCYFRLVHGDAAEKEARFLQSPGPCVIEQYHFSSVPGSPVIYWVGTRLAELFERFPPIGETVPIREGIHTGDNERFTRFWWEPGGARLVLDASDPECIDAVGGRWVPYNKGGEYTRWYGNNIVVLAYDAVARDGMAALKGHVRPSQSLYFKAGGTWVDVGSNGLGVKFYPDGYLFDGAGPVVVGGDRNAFLIGGMNSEAFQYVCELLMPTIHYKCGTVKMVPLPNDVNSEVLGEIEGAVSLARTDWDNSETSWDFTDLPLLRPELKGPTLEASWRSWEAYLQANIARMQELETENNRLWIEAYGLEDELTAEVPEEEITLARPDRRKDVAAFLSYAVGCMMGRYSLDEPGLVLADAGDTLEDYLAKVGRPLEELSFAPDEDAVIPVLDGEWFEDDVVARTREFLGVAFGADTLEENLRFIEDSLGKDLRRYFARDFFKDHLQTYKKRPIYWMFQSPKKSFQCLVYLHRYTRDTPHHVLNRYLREYLAKVQYRLEHLEHVLASESISSREKTLARKETDELRKALRECEEWEREVLLPLAQQQLELDLDDGVKVNYLKLGKALAPIPGLAAKGADG